MAGQPLGTTEASLTLVPLGDGGSGVLAEVSPAGASTVFETEAGLNGSARISSADTDDDTCLAGVQLS